MIVGIVIGFVLAIVLAGVITQVIPLLLAGGVIIGGLIAFIIFCWWLDKVFSW